MTTTPEYDRLKHDDKDGYDLNKLSTSIPKALDAVSERDLFEATFGSSRVLMRATDDSYVSMYVQNDWEVWQAARAVPSTSTQQAAKSAEASDQDDFKARYDAAKTTSALAAAKSASPAAVEAAYQEHIHKTMPPMDDAGRSWWHFSAGFAAATQAPAAMRLTDERIMRIAGEEFESEDFEFTGEVMRFARAIEAAALSAATPATKGEQS